MEERLITHLDECMAAIEAGESIESCLARYPDEAAELAPLLQISLALEGLPQPAPAAATTRKAKSQFMAQAEQRREATKQSLWARMRQRLAIPSLPGPARALATVATALTLVLLVGSGAVFAASDSLPGEPLYGFKLLGEDVQRALTFNGEDRIRLEESFTERRRDEVRQLLSRGRQQEVVFGGLLQERNGSYWQIEDIPVTVDADTRVQGDPVGL